MIFWFTCSFHSICPIITWQKGFLCHRSTTLEFTPSWYPKLLFSTNIPFQTRNTPLQNCVSSLSSFPSPLTFYPDFDSCYSHFMPYRKTPSVRHEAIEVHYHYYYYYYYYLAPATSNLSTGRHPIIHTFTPDAQPTSIFHASPHPHTQKTVPIHTALSATPHTYISPSDLFRPFQTADSLYSSPRSQSHMSIHSGHKPCISSPLCGMMHPELSG